MKNILTFEEFLNEQENQRYSKYSKIFEESFTSYQNRFKLDDKYVKNWLEENPYECRNLLEYYMENIYDSDEDLDDEDLDDEDLDDEDLDEMVRNSSDFIEYVLDILYDNYNNFLYSVEDLIDSEGNLKIYRVMSDKKEWETHLKQYGKHLGIYWSWDKNGAESHWGKGGSEIILTAEINEKYIDWENSTIQNIHTVYFEEKEITLVKGTKIKLLNVNIDGKDIDMTPFKDRIFYA